MKWQHRHFLWDCLPSLDGIASTPSGLQWEPSEGSASDGMEVVLEAGRGTKHFISCTLGPSRCLSASPAASSHGVF